MLLVAYQVSSHMGHLNPSMHKSFKQVTAVACRCFKMWSWTDWVKGFQVASRTWKRETLPCPSPVEDREMAVSSPLASFRHETVPGNRNASSSASGLPCLQNPQSKGFTRVMPQNTCWLYEIKENLGQNWYRRGKKNPDMPTLRLPKLRFPSGKMYASLLPCTNKTESSWLYAKGWTVMITFPWAIFSLTPLATYNLLIVVEG